MTELDRRSFLAHAAGAAAAVTLFPEVLPAAPRTSAEPLTVGVIGCGRQARRIAQEFTDYLGDAARITAVCDPNESRAQTLSGRVKGAEVFKDHGSLLSGAKDVRAVIIATPTHTHKEIALAAMGAGKHVYCEAPLAHTTEDCLAISRAARGSKAVFAVGCEGRANPVYQLARKFFKTDAIRDVVSLYAQDHRKTPWGTPKDWWLDPATSIGLPGEAGVQQFDVFHWFRGSYPVEVAGRGSVRLHDDGRTTPDTVRCTFRWSDGVELHYQATLANSFGGRFETLFGVNAAIKLAWSHGWMFKESDAPQLGFEIYANKQQFHNDEGITLIAGATKLAEQGKLKEGVGLPNTPLYYSLADFVKSVSEGADVRCSASEGARATIVALAAHLAVRTGAPVMIDPEVLKGA